MLTSWSRQAFRTLAEEVVVYPSWLGIGGRCDILPSMSLPSTWTSKGKPCAAESDPGPFQVPFRQIALQRHHLTLHPSPSALPSDVNRYQSVELTVGWQQELRGVLWWKSHLVTGPRVLYGELHLEMPEERSWQAKAGLSYVPESELGDQCTFALLEKHFVI